MATMMINGPEGQIEARYMEGKEEDAPIALFLHPHPMHGGTMNNKVIYNLFHTFHKRGFAVLRFNFRGVGLSEGSFAKGEGELADAAAALDWLQVMNPNAKHCWIIGFSFGAWIGMQLLMRRPDVIGFMSVAPPSNMYDFSFLSPCPASGLILQGSEDTVVPVDKQEELATRLTSQRHVEVIYEIIDGADHFFSEHMSELQRICAEYLDNRLTLLSEGKGTNMPFFGLEDLGDSMFDDDEDLLDDELLDDDDDDE